MMAACDPRHGRYLTAAAIFRGRMSMKVLPFSIIYFFFFSKTFKFRIYDRIWEKYTNFLVTKKIILDYLEQII